MLSLIAREHRHYSSQEILLQVPFSSEGVRAVLLQTPSSYAGTRTMQLWLQWSSSSLQFLEAPTAGLGASRRENWKQPHADPTHTKPCSSQTWIGSLPLWRNSELAITSNFCSSSGKMVCRNLESLEKEETLKGQTEQGKTTNKTSEEQSIMPDYFRAK